MDPSHPFAGDTKPGISRLVSSPPSPPGSSGNIPASPTAPIKRRAPIACRRCRRMRSKCIHEKHSPCKSCAEAGLPQECVFPSRGDSDFDRQFRHPRQRADKKLKIEVPKVKRECISTPSLSDAPFSAKAAKWGGEWSLLPEVDLVKEGVIAFTRNFFQLGFIPKERFPIQLVQNPKSISAFLLLSILSISARFNKKFEARYGAGQQAVELFAQHAQQLALKELYEPPTLERCQAFLLLSIAQQGNGLANASYINMGVATRMAALMRLHREETYERVTEDSTVEEIIRAESARRTLWVIHSQDNLHSGPYKPVSLANSDITALLPSDEDEFKNGKIPKIRAGLEGTPPAIRNPQLATLEKRSLFASLMQVHCLWGIIARRAVANEKSSSPGDAGSEYAKMARRLADFESNLPFDHKFNKKLLKGYRQDSEDLAYIGVTGAIRLCNIVLRKAYLDEMIHMARGSKPDPRAQIYQHMAQELFENVKGLYEQVDAQFDDNRPAEERVGSQMAAFCVYGCGLLAAYLCKFPHLIPHTVPRGSPDPIQILGRIMYERTVEILEETRSFWPMASSWLNGLRKWYEDPNSNGISFHGGSMTDGKDPQSYALLHPPTSTSAWKTKMTNFYPPRSAPPPYSEQMIAAETGPAELPPLQPVQSAYGDPPSLPPLSPYVQHPQSQTAPQHELPMTTYPHQNLGFHALYQAGHHQTPTIMEYPQPYLQDYAAAPIGDDGFDFHLQQFLDTNWSAPNAPAALYNYPTNNGHPHTS